MNTLSSAVENHCRWLSVHSVFARFFYLRGQSPFFARCVVSLNNWKKKNSQRGPCEVGNKLLLKPRAHRGANNGDCWQRDKMHIDVRDCQGWFAKCLPNVWQTLATLDGWRALFSNFLFLWILHHFTSPTWAWEISVTLNKL